MATGPLYPDTATGGRDRQSCQRIIVGAVALTISALIGATVPGGATSEDVTYLDADDFRYGTYVIDEPGVYRLAEDISFDPNSPDTLSQAIDDGVIPAEAAASLELPSPVDPHFAGLPLATQLVPGGVDDFTPAGPLDARYDPAAFGLGFFAAISITADDVVLDLAGHTLEQSAEHALLQRWFAVVELADQPFGPAPGPAAFGSELDAAHRVVIENGTIGRSAHHGVHGNGNSDVTVTGVDFEGYEVAAIALNGVDGLVVKDVTASNRKDIPVLGTYSSARFIEAYVDYLVDSGSPTTLTVGGKELRAVDVYVALCELIDQVHQDLVDAPHIVDGRAQIDAVSHPLAYALFHNQSGLPDGNSYSFLLNDLGVAVNGFPTVPDGVTRMPSRDIVLEDVEVHDQSAAIIEVVAIDADGSAIIDPAGAVFQTRNAHPDTGAPITISSWQDAEATYVGNPVANAQALVAKAAARGEFEGSHLDVTRSNMPSTVLAWVEGASGSETLADIAARYICNGDPMFHVNKGVIAFKMDAAEGVELRDTVVDGLANYGAAGSTVCGDYGDGISHPNATLHGYGGTAVRAYTFAGSKDVRVERAEANDVSAARGPAVGFAIMTDTTDAGCTDCVSVDVLAGWEGSPAGEGLSPPAVATGFLVSDQAQDVSIDGGCVADLSGADGEWFIYDQSGAALVTNTCADQQDGADAYGVVSGAGS